MVTDVRYCLPLPEAISFEVATQLACTAGTSFSAVYSILPNGLDPAGGWQAPEIASVSDTIYIVFVSTAIPNNAIFSFLLCNC